MNYMQRSWVLFLLALVVLGCGADESAHFVEGPAPTEVALVPQPRPTGAVLVPDLTPEPLEPVVVEVRRGDVPDASGQDDQEPEVSVDTLSEDDVEVVPETTEVVVEIEPEPAASPIVLVEDRDDLEGMLDASMGYSVGAADAAVVVTEFGDFL